jgi:hypothetical protein
VENQTPTPVALAFAIRPYHLTRLGRIRRLRLEGATVSVEGRPVVFLPRPAARVAASSLADGDSARRVFDGTDDAGADFDIACDGGGAQAAFVYPLAHGATFRAAILLSGDAPSGVVGGRIAALPGSTEVARGWAAQTRRGMRLELPSGALADAVEANRRFLLLLSQGAGSRSDLAPLRRALAAYGFDREADELPKARGHLLPRWLRPGRTSPIDPADALERVQHMLTTASPTWTWPEGHDAHAAAELLLLVRDVLVREVDGGVALLPRLPDVWRGQPFEVHDAPIAGGKVSYAVRWHGDLPALLWELDAPRAVRLTAPGLDPAWSTTEPAGETLLAAPVPR